MHVVNNKSAAADPRMRRITAEDFVTPDLQGAYGADYKHTRMRLTSDRDT